MDALRSRRIIEKALPAFMMTAVAMVILAPAGGVMGHLRPILLEGLVLVLGAIALARRPAGALGGRVGALLRAGPNLPLLLLLIYALVSARLAPYKGLANAEWLRFAGGVVLYFLAAYAAQARDRYRQVVDGLIVLALLGTLTELSLSAQHHAAMSALFGNRQILASFLLLLLPLLLTVSLAARNGARKIAAQVAFIMVAAGLIMAQTRSAWAGAVVALVVLATIYAGRSAGARELAQSKHRIVLLLVPLLGAVGLLVVVSLACPELIARMRTLGDLPGDVNIQWRQHQWAGTMKMIAAHPWSGWGLGSYAVAINHFVPDSTPASMVLKLGSNLTQNAHCLYLQTLAELGLVGTGLYLWALVAFFVTGFRALRGPSSPGRLAVLAACLATVAGQAVDATANPAYQFGEVSLLFWLIVGLGMAAARIVPHPALAQNEGSEPAGRRHGASRRLVWRGATLSLAGLVLASGFALGQNFLPAEPVYTQIAQFTLTGRSGSSGYFPGYSTATVVSGECIELQVALQFVGSDVYQAERSPYIQYTIGGTAPPGSVVQEPAPNQNVFCVPSTVGSEATGTHVDLTATYVFRGQTYTRTVTFNLAPSTCGISAVVDRPVLAATGNLEPVNVTFSTASGAAIAPLAPIGGSQPTIYLQEVQILPYTTDSRSGSVVIGANGTQLQLKAVAGRTYVLLYRVVNPSRLSRCYIRLTVLVSTRSTFESPAPPTTK